MTANQAINANTMYQGWRHTIEFSVRDFAPWRGFVEGRGMLPPPRKGGYFGIRLAPLRDMPQSAPSARRAASCGR
jgi:hypothetical protein